MSEVILEPNESIDLTVVEPDDVIELTLGEQDDLNLDLDVVTVVTSDHNQLINRSMDDQHPISAITDLEETLDGLEDDISDLETELGTKQDTLISGVNIKTINGESILGPGDIETLNAAASSATERLTLWYGQTV